MEVNGRLLRCVLVVLLICAIGSTNSSFLKGQEVSLALRAAERRQACTITFDVTIGKVEWIGKGAMSELSGGEAEMARKNYKTVIPDKEMSYKSTERLLIDRSRVRYEVKGSKFYMPKAELIPSETLFISDGQQAKDFSANIAQPDGGETIPGGNIQTRDNPLRFGTVQLLPLFMSLRGASDDFDFVKLKELIPSSKVMQIEGVPCEEYHRPSKGISPPVFFVWLDPNREYVITRIQINSPNGNPQVRIDIRYERNDNCGWLPKSWTQSDYSPSTRRLLTSTDVTIEKMLLNASYPITVFQKEFSPGTRVTDDNDGSVFLVRKDGTMSKLRGPQDTSNAKHENGSRMTFVWALVGVILFVTSVLLWRRRRKRIS